MGRCRQKPRERPPSPAAGNRAGFPIGRRDCEQYRMRHDCVAIAGGAPRMAAPSKYAGVGGLLVACRAVGMSQGKTNMIGFSLVMCAGVGRRQGGHRCPRDLRSCGHAPAAGTPRAALRASGGCAGRDREDAGAPAAGAWPQWSDPYNMGRQPTTPVHFIFSLCGCTCTLFFSLCGCVFSLHWGLYYIFERRL